MQNVTTIFEHEQIEFPWTDRELADLERLNQSNRKVILRATVREGKRCLQASEYVGLIQLRKHRIQVLPKIYQSATTNTSEQARQAMGNLLHLLAIAGQIPIKEQAVQQLLKRNLDWFEILTRLFTIHLVEEWQRGVHRSYREVDDNLIVLKGKWRLADQLRHPDRQHLFSVIYDEFTADVPLNRLLRYVVERLWKLTQNPENRRLLSLARHWMESVSLPPTFSSDEADRILLNRLNRRYEPVLNLARFFLAGSVPQMELGDNSIFAYVFDMNILYEAFVTNFIRKHREALPYYLQDCELLPQARGSATYLARVHERKTFQLKPDLAFKIEDTFPLLLDTKYKRLDGHDMRLGVATSDFYQMYAYSRRYQCPQVLLLYPQTVEMSGPIHARFRLEGVAGEIRVETVDLRIDISSWQDKQRLIIQLRNILEG